MTVVTEITEENNQQLQCPISDILKTPMTRGGGGGVSTEHSHLPQGMGDYNTCAVPSLCSSDSARLSTFRPSPET